MNETSAATWTARKEGPVCLVGIPSDPVLKAVAAELDRRRAPWFLLDQDRFPGEVGVSYGSRGGVLSGSVSVDGRRWELSALRSAFARLLPAPSAQGRYERWESERFLALDHLTRVWGVPTIGLLNPCAPNFSKPYQISLIASGAVRVPQTLLTTRPASALAWARRRPEVSFKSASSERSVCVRLDRSSRRRLGHLARLPGQFQEYVRGLDIRVHVAGRFVHALAIETRATDYRYSQRRFGQKPRAYELELPAHVREELIALTRRQGLVLSGIDLRRTEAGEYFCFEVNPTPGFAPFDPAPRRPIARAVCALLTGEARA